MILQWQDFPPAVRDKIVKAAAEAIAEKEILGRVYRRTDLPERLKVSLSTVDRWLASGELKAQISGEGKSYLITEESIRKFLKMR